MSDEITSNTQTPSADALADRQTEPQIEPISEPIETTIPSEPEIPAVEPETQTPQIPVNEALDTPEVKTTEPSAESINIQTDKEPETTPEELPPSASLLEKKPPAPSEPETSETKTNQPEPEKEILESNPESNLDPKPKKPEITPVIVYSKKLARELLIKARNAIQFRKRKKLDRVLSLFAKQTKITNDEIEKFLHVSDATATRYLSQLEKEGKIKQTGKTGKSVFYSKI